MIDNKVTELGSPGSSGVALLCNKVIWMSVLVSVHFLIVHFMNLMYTSTCAMLWWWYDEYVSCSVVRCLQNCLNIPEKNYCLCLTLFSLANHILKKIILQASIKLSVDRSSAFLAQLKTFSCAMPIIMLYMYVLYMLYTWCMLYLW